MSLIREIQTSLVQGNTDLGPLLLKLRFVASRLGSLVLEEWVKHEAEGYPSDVSLPVYRQIGISYVADFSGPFNSGIRNAPIPSYLIEKYAGKNWTTYRLRQSASSIDSLVASAKTSGTLQIDSANLILLLQDKIYEGYSCNSVRGKLSVSQLVEVQNALRNRMLELTIELEQKLPSAMEISIGTHSHSVEETNKALVSQIVHHTILGNVTNIANSPSAQLTIQSSFVGNSEALLKSLLGAGIPEPEAEELVQIVTSEKPSSAANDALGPKAKAWIKRNAPKVLDGAWNVGLDVVTAVVTEAAKKYYGFG